MLGGVWYVYCVPSGTTSVMEMIESNLGEAREQSGNGSSKRRFIQSMQKILGQGARYISISKALRRSYRALEYSHYNVHRSFMGDSFRARTPIESHISHLCCLTVAYLPYLIQSDLNMPLLAACRSSRSRAELHGPRS